MQQLFTMMDIKRRMQVVSICSVHNQSLFWDYDAATLVPMSVVAKSSVPPTDFHPHRRHKG